jgi:hypothetical protein
MDKKEYIIVALDKDGFELKRDYGFTSIKSSLKKAREFINDPDITHELYKVEIRNEFQEVEWDYFIQ